jgi:CRP/FNR family transcriptional regulator, cyclic AMP receptor protein
MELSLLASLDPTQRERLIGRCVRRHYQRRQVIFHHGDPSDGMHLIVSGRVMIRVSTPLGEEACLTLSGPGDPVGEQSLLLDGGRRSASAVALDPVETIFLSRSAFAALRRDDAALDRVLIQILTARVLRLTNQLIEALFVPATTRVLRRVADAAALYGEGVIPLTQDEIASMAGCTRPTVNRALRSAQDAGMVDLARRRIRVLDIDGLRELLG